MLVGFRFPPGMLRQLPNLRWLQLTSAGYEHVRDELPPEIVLTHAGSVPAIPVAEHVLMGLLALSREAPTLVRQQDRREWRPPGARLLWGKTLLLVGLGRIGSEIARRAGAFGMRVVAVTRSGHARVPVARCVGPAHLADEARHADHLVVCVPGDESTRGLINAEILATLKDGYTLIDVSRASVVDRDALVHALRRRTCRGAMVDVHALEPLPADHSSWSEPGLWITPHCAYEQDGEVAALAELVSRNLVAWHAGRLLENLVSSRDVGIVEDGQ